MIKNNASRALIDRINDFNLATAFDPNATTTMMMMIRRRKEMFSVFKHKIHSFEKYLHKYQPVEQQLQFVLSWVAHNCFTRFLLFLFPTPHLKKTKTSIILILDLKLSKRKKDSKPNFFSIENTIFLLIRRNNLFCKTSKKKKQ